MTLPGQVREQGILFSPNRGANSGPCACCAGALPLSSIPAPGADARRRKRCDCTVARQQRRCWLCSQVYTPCRKSHARFCQSSLRKTRNQASTERRVSKSLSLIVPALTHFIRIELSVVGIWALSRIRSLVLGCSSPEECLPSVQGPGVNA